MEEKGIKHHWRSSHIRIPDNMDFDMVRDAIHEAIGFLNDARFGPRKIATPMVSEKQERPGFVCVEITAPDFLLAQRRAARLVPAQGMER